MNDLLMILGLALVGFVLWRGLNNKPIIPGLNNRKKKKTDERSVSKAKEIEGDFKELIGLKDIHGNMIELLPENDIRCFVGAVKCRPINYQLRSYQEQINTDNAYEELLAKLSLGPGREVKIAIHVQSRPIELVDQLKQYHENFQNLNEVAQRYAKSMFYPFLEQWQNSVDEFDYERYFFVELEYSPRMLEELDEETIIAKALNEFVRLSGNIISSYGRMGGVAEMCRIEDLLEAMYFATHKRTGTIEGFRKLMKSNARLSNIVMSDYSREPYKISEEDELHEEDKEDAKTA